MASFLGTALLAAVCLCLSALPPPAACWTYTFYEKTTTQVNAASVTTIFPQLAVPTGPVTPTSTAVATTSLYGGFGTVFVFPITLTTLFLPADASACFPAAASGCTPRALAPPPDVATATAFFAPREVRNPASCTLTAFVYTTAQQVELRGLEQGFVDLAPQATDPSALAFQTRYVSTISTDLDGTVVTTARLDVYLKSGVVLGGTPGAREAYFLDECVDPRKWLCASQAASTGGCTLPPGSGTYPPMDVGGNTTTTGAGAKLTAGRGLLVQRSILCALGALAWSYFVL